MTTSVTAITDSTILTTSQSSQFESCSSASTRTARSAPLLSPPNDREEGAGVGSYDGAIDIPDVVTTSALIMEDFINDNEEVGDTDSVAFADKLIDLIESTYDSFKSKMSVLVKEEDDREEATSERN